MKLVTRPYAPTIVVALSCPRTKQAWALSNDCFDYRSAANSGALETRDGQWYSRCETSFTGDLSLRCPLDADLPPLLHVNMRVSWYPAHCAITWLDGGQTFQKLSHRAPEGEPSRWELIAYNDDVFTVDHRNLYPEAFVIVPVPVRPPIPETSQTVTEPSGEARAQEEKFPPKAVTEEKESNHQGHQDWSWNDWHDSNWVYDTEHGNNDRWSQTYSDSSPEPTKTSPPSSPNQTPIVNDPSVPEPPVVSSAEVTISPPSTESVPVAEVTADQESQLEMTVKPKSSSHSVLSGSEALEALLELQTMSLTGPPTTRENRLKRQALASTLALKPELYNHLVFGEPVLTEDVTAHPVPTTLPSPSGVTTVIPNVMVYSVRHSRNIKELLRPETNIAENTGLYRKYCLKSQIITT